MVTVQVSCFDTSQYRRISIFGRVFFLFLGQLALLVHQKGGEFIYFAWIQSCTFGSLLSPFICLFGQLPKVYLVRRLQGSQVLPRYWGLEHRRRPLFPWKCICHILDPTNGCLKRNIPPESWLQGQKKGQLPFLTILHRFYDLLG